MNLENNCRLLDERLVGGFGRQQAIVETDCLGASNVRIIASFLMTGFGDVWTGSSEKPDFQTKSYNSTVKNHYPLGSCDNDWQGARHRCLLFESLLINSRPASNIPIQTLLAPHCKQHAVEQIEFLRRDRLCARGSVLNSGASRSIAPIRSPSAGA